jgi:hypothetical protein
VLYVAPREGRSRGRQARIPANLQPARLVYVFIHSHRFMACMHCQHGPGIAASRNTCRWESLDSLAQSCGLSLPTFNQRGWFMTPSIHVAPSSSACTAGTSPASRPQKRVDFLTRYCGLSLPTLFERIGTMAASGQPLPSPFHAARTRGRGALSAFLRKRHRPPCRPDLPQGSTTGAGWRSPSRRAGPPPTPNSGEKAWARVLVRSRDRDGTNDGDWR